MLLIQVCAKSVGHEFGTNGHLFIWTWNLCETQLFYTKYGPCVKARQHCACIIFNYRNGQNTQLAFSLCILHGATCKTCTQYRESIEALESWHFKNVRQGMNSLLYGIVQLGNHSGWISPINSGCQNWCIRIFLHVYIYIYISFPK